MFYGSVCATCGDSQRDLGQYWCAYDIPSYDHNPHQPIGFCNKCVPEEVWNTVTMYYDTDFGFRDRYIALSLPCAIEDDRKISADLSPGIRLFTVQKI